MSKLYKVKEYFAAANGYNGFRSNFNSIFNSSEFNKIYVLKGGPGTGKSSFMKKLAQSASDMACNVERIYCSSDPHSLDGAIVIKNGKKIAVLDGTSPHERDAVIPGAIDCIINLGENWDSRWLEAKRDMIYELCNAKSKAYQTAYHYLSLCGVCDKRITASIRLLNTVKILDFEINTEADCLFQGACLRASNKLISSFGKHGRYSLTQNKSDYPKIFTPSTDYFTSKLLLKNLCIYLQIKGIKMQCFADPLDGNFISSIYVPQINTIISSDGGEELSANFSQVHSAADEESIKLTRKIYYESLAEAQRWFSIASDIHFRLEEIYSEAMDFEKNDRLFEEKYAEIMDILS